MDIMNIEPNNASSEMTHQLPSTPPKLRYDPKQLPLVKLLKLLKMFARSDSDITYAESCAMHAAWREMDSVSQFALNIQNRVKNRDAKYNLDDLYLYYCQFCVAKKWHPHRQDRFEWMLRLEAKAKAAVDVAGPDGATTTAA